VSSLLPYRHREQRPFHLLRYGVAHFFHHFGAEDHAHRRDFAPPKDPRQTWVTYGMVALALLVVFLVALVLLSIKPLLDARHDLTTAKNLISADLANKALLETADGRAQLAEDIGTVQEDAAEASSSMRGSTALSWLGALPYVDTQRQGVLQLCGDLEKAAQAGNTMLASLNSLVTQSHGTSVSLPALATLELVIIDGYKALGSVDRPANGLLGPIASARTAFDREDAKLRQLLRLSARTINFARPFLGDEGPQSYLIAGLNNAEMRDSGAVLSLDLLTATNGTFSIAHDASYGDYALSSPAPVTLPAGTQKVFGSYLPTLNWPSTDATADWALSGQMMQAMWLRATGQQVDGVIGMDVPGVARILSVTGPVRVPGEATPVGASNIADLLLNRAYQGLTVNDPQAERRDMIAAVVKAAVNKMKTEHVDLDAFANALAYDVDGRHLMVWSDVPSDESGLVSLDAAGTLNSAQPDRTFHVAVENGTADKLDYFVHVSVGMKVTVDPSGNAVVDTTVSVANTAQSGHAPSYQYGPDHVNAFTPGQYGAKIFFWGPTGADVPGAVSESGLQLVESNLSLLAGQHGKVSFATYIPHAVVDGHLDLRLVPQARLKPDHLTLTVSAPAWNISGPSKISRLWASTLDLRWALTG
jgi:hypothetical protein